MSTARTTLFVLTLLLTGWVSGSVFAQTGQELAPVLDLAGDEVKLDKEKVRYGDASRFDPAKKPAVATVRSKDVYPQIPAYQRIVKEKIDKESALGQKLMREATSAFKTALEKVAKDNSYVLIVEEGGIEGYPTTDATQAIITALPKPKDEYQLRESRLSLEQNR